ncbi:hypothetical protein [Dactylosporangium salmoneum]|uniref:DNA-binding protein n=1 Tax=Dactylosporangium salmoneum TaxID=53361 RepID=A0ABP5SFS1_9ACTN
MNRTLTLDLLDGRRNYESAAFCDGGVVHLRLTGWSDGYAITELVAEIPAADAADVGGLLASTLSAFRAPPPEESFFGSLLDEALPSGPPPSPPQRVPISWPPPDTRPPNAGRPWAPEDLDLLVTRVEQGASVKTLTAELGRTEAAVRTRLQMLRAPRPSPAPPRPPGPAAPPAPD